jgi:hypothetical protein
MKTESDREWSRYAWSKIRFGLIAFLGFGLSFMIGVNDFVSGGNLTLVIVELVFAVMCLCVGWGQLDDAWPWITEKVDKMIY